MPATENTIPWGRAARDAASRLWRGPRRAAWISAVVLLAALLPLCWAARSWQHERLLGQERARLEAELSPRGNSLSNEINRRLARVDALYSFVQMQAVSREGVVDREFHLFAAGLNAGLSGIRNLAMAPDGVFRYVYPEEGNQNVIGYRPVDDPRPQVSEDARRAIEQRVTVVTGPDELIQGGMGLIVRRAVYCGGRYWGLVSLVLDMPPMLDDAGLSKASATLDVAIRDRHGRVFFGPPEVFAASPVLYRIDLPDGNWELGGIPRGGWEAPMAGQMLLFSGLTFSMALLLSALAYMVVNRQAVLAVMVRRRTGDFLRVNRQLEQQLADRKRAEERLRQSYKMEAIGRLAGGIAHDFNNLLAVISGYSESMLRRLGDDEDLRDGAEEISKAADRGAGLVRQLLAFSRQQVISPQVLDLNRLVQELETMLRRVISKDIEVVTQLGEDLDCVKADPGQLEQVVLNLALNARDAMPGGGRLTIATGSVELDGEQATSLEVPQGRYVRLLVSDTGQGIPAELQSRIFDPFFTTKEGKGTGLGLSIVYGIVHQAGGAIHVCSQCGQGASFEVLLPAAGAEAPVALE